MGDDLPRRRCSGTTLPHQCVISPVDKIVERGESRQVDTWRVRLRGGTTPSGTSSPKYPLKVSRRIHKSADEFDTSLLQLVGIAFCAEMLKTLLIREREQRPICQKAVMPELNCRIYYVIQLVATSQNLPGLLCLFLNRGVADSFTDSKTCACAWVGEKWRRFRERSIYRFNVRVDGAADRFVAIVKTFRIIPQGRAAVVERPAVQ